MPVLALSNCVQFSPHPPPNRPSSLGFLAFIDNLRGASNRLDQSLMLEGGREGPSSVPRWGQLLSVSPALVQPPRALGEFRQT